MQSENYPVISRASRASVDTSIRDKICAPRSTNDALRDRTRPNTQDTDKQPSLKGLSSDQTPSNLDAQTLENVSIFIEKFHGREDRVESNKTRTSTKASSEMEESMGKFLSVLSNDDEDLAEEFGRVLSQGSDEERVDQLRPETLLAIGNYIDAAVAKNSQGLEAIGEDDVLPDEDTEMLGAIADFIDTVQKKKKRSSSSGSMGAVLEDRKDLPGVTSSKHASGDYGTSHGSEIRSSEVMEILSALADFIDSAQRKERKLGRYLGRCDDDSLEIGSTDISDVATCFDSTNRINSSHSGLDSDDVLELLGSLATYIDTAQKRKAELRESPRSQASVPTTGSEDETQTIIGILTSIAEYIDASKRRKERRNERCLEERLDTVTRSRLASPANSTTSVATGCVQAESSSEGVLEMLGSIAEYIDTAQKHHLRKHANASSKASVAEIKRSASDDISETDLDTISTLRNNCDSASSVSEFAPLRSGLVSDDLSVTGYSVRSAASVAPRSNVISEPDTSENISHQASLFSPVPEETVASVKKDDEESTLCSQLVSQGPVEEHGSDVSSGNVGGGNLTTAPQQDDSPGDLSKIAIVKSSFRNGGGNLTIPSQQDDAPGDLSMIAIAKGSSGNLGGGNLTTPSQQDDAPGDLSKIAIVKSSFGNGGRNLTTPSQQDDASGDLSKIAIAKGSSGNLGGGNLPTPSQQDDAPGDLSKITIAKSLSEDLSAATKIDRETLATIGAYIDSLAAPKISSDVEFPDALPGSWRGSSVAMKESGFSDCSRGSSVVMKESGFSCSSGESTDEDSVLEVTDSLDDVSGIPQGLCANFSEGDLSISDDIPEVADFSPDTLETIGAYIDSVALCKPNGQKNNSITCSTGLCEEGRPRGGELDAERLDEYIERLASKDDDSQGGDVVPKEILEKVAAMIDSSRKEDTSVSRASKTRREAEVVEGSIETETSGWKSTGSYSLDIPGHLKDVLRDSVAIETNTTKGAPPDPPLHLTKSEEERGAVGEPEVNPAKSVFPSDQEEGKERMKHFDSETNNMTMASVPEGGATKSENIEKLFVDRDTKNRSCSASPEEEEEEGQEGGNEPSSPVVKPKLSSNEGEEQEGGNEPSNLVVKKKLSSNEGEEQEGGNEPSSLVVKTKLSSNEGEEQEEKKEESHEPNDLVAKKTLLSNEKDASTPSFPEDNVAIPSSEGLETLASMLLCPLKPSSEDRDKVSVLVSFVHPRVDGIVPTAAGISQIMSKVNELNLPLNVADRLLSLAQYLVDEVQGGEIEMAPSDELVTVIAQRRTGTQYQQPGKTQDSTIELFVRRLVDIGEATARFQYAPDTAGDDYADDIDIRFTEGNTDEEAIEMDILAPFSNEEVSLNAGTRDVHSNNDDKSLNATSRDSVTKVLTEEGEITRNYGEAITDIDAFWDNQLKNRNKRFGYPSETIARNQRLFEEGTYSQSDFTWPAPSESHVSSSTSFESIENGWTRKKSMGKWNQGGVMNNLWSQHGKNNFVDVPKEINAVATTARLFSSGPLRRRNKRIPRADPWKHTYKDRTTSHSGYLGVHCNSLTESLQLSAAHTLDKRPWEHRLVKQRFLYEQSVSFCRNWFGLLLPIDGNQICDQPICSVSSMPMPVRAGEWIEEWYNRPGDRQLHEDFEDELWDDIPECGRIRNVKLKIGERISRVTPNHTSSLRRSRWRKKHFPRGTFPY